jgi:hypothetical protein
VHGIAQGARAAFPSQAILVQRIETSDFLRLRWFRRRNAALHHNHVEQAAELLANIR